ncbi:single-stranded-DNA-specific exonuclease C-terminal domain-containing protein, partial [Mycobacterium kansasii]
MTTLHAQMFTTVGVYVFFHRNIYQQLRSQLPEQATAILVDGTTQAPVTAEQLVFIVDCPDMTVDLTNV